MKVSRSFQNLLIDLTQYDISENVFTNWISTEKYEMCNVFC